MYCARELCIVMYTNNGVESNNVPDNVEHIIVNDYPAEIYPLKQCRH